MRRQFKLWVSCLASLTSFLLVPCVVAQPKLASIAPLRDEAFSVLQKHYLLGRWQIFVNKDKVKAVNLSEGYSIVTMAPTWKVMFYRDGSTPKMYETTMREFLVAGIPLSSYYVIEGRLDQAKKSRAQFKGLNTVLFTLMRADRTKVKPAWTLGDLPPESPVVLSKYWLAPAISNNDTVCKFVQKLFMMPATNGYPVAFVDVRADHTHTAVLDITSCKGFPPAAVQIVYPTPAKYKVCKGQRDVTLSAGKREGLNDWAEVLGKD
ncbi:MAG: hypothetical protein JST44_18490 [Cyanobacteria bacterium SZAS LIN-5]|nr:hypothetical protein [Cyanobacteria bacterium SZAS LIN-5]